jgi:hypothetical protein
MYAAYQSTTTNVAIAAASSTQWRSDYIVAQITDPGDNTAAWSLVDVQGAFSSSAPGTLPAIPANAIPLSIIRVVPNMTVTNGGGTVNDARIWQPLPGPLMTTSSARPSLSSPEGTLWFETDTNNLGIIINGAYNYIPTSPAATDSWHTMSSFLNGWAATTNTPRYKLSGRNTVILDGAIDATSSTAGTFFTMPTGYRPISPNKLYAAGANGGVIANNSPFISVANTGSIATGGITVGTSGVHVTISGEYPLD